MMDRVGRVGTARLVAEAIGVQTVHSEPDSTLLVDVTVLLGPEWKRPPAPEAPGDANPWWDIRRFFRGQDSAGAEISME